MASKAKKKSDKSESSLRSTKSAKAKDEDSAPLDVLMLKILSLRLPEDDPSYYAMQVTFFDQLLISAIIKPLGIKDKDDKERILAKGTMNYDPSDYDKMCLFADKPLVVYIQPLKNVDSEWLDGPVNTPSTGVSSQKQSATPSKGAKASPQQDSAKTKKRSICDISVCNIDILPLFLDTEKLCIKKRLEPMIPLKMMYRKSWDNLPLLTMSIMVVRNEENARHHRVLREANWLRLTVIGTCNMIVPYDHDCYYTAATRLPTCNETVSSDAHSFLLEECSVFTYNKGFRVPRNFRHTNFYPRWESLRLEEETFTKSDDKVFCTIEDVKNPENFDLVYYFKSAPSSYQTVWGSFHRTLMLGNKEAWFKKHILRWKWPVEIHFYGEMAGGFSFMAFLDLFDLLYPGENRLTLAVPLEWFNASLMMAKCNCDVLIMPNEKGPSANTARSKPQPTKKMSPDSYVTLASSDEPNTGADENKAFVLVEVQMLRPFFPESIPRFIHKSEIMTMLYELEASQKERACTGRGQLARNWQATVTAAARLVHRVPHHGLMEFCNFNRQLSETRTRVEILTSFETDAAIFVNNNFVVRDYLATDELFEEMLTMSHVCLMKIALETLTGEVNDEGLHTLLKPARHARHLYDISHALELYMQAAIKRPFEGDCWRELSTCLKDLDKDWAAVCLNKAVLTGIRHPLTILSKGCMIFDEDVDAAEPFFDALLELYPFWPTSYIVCYAYYTTREFYKLGDVIMDSLNLMRKDHLTFELHLAHGWEKELGDFWEPTVLLPGMSPYYEVVDLLLRIRAISLAEVCLGLSLAETGESAAYFHLIALCARLRGDIDNALCFVAKGIEKFGEINYLLCLQGECYHQQENLPAAVASFEKANGGTCAYRLNDNDNECADAFVFIDLMPLTLALSILLSLPCWQPPHVRNVLVDLLRRQPSAYAWMAMANDWLLRAELGDTSEEALTEEQSSALVCATASAVQALKYDRRAGRAWALLSKLVTPSKRRTFCSNMATDCGFLGADDIDIRSLKIKYQDSVCYRIGTVLHECRCKMCEALRF
ncbi:uncharacterized protein LOC126380609 [Pectinophora gossypiella]|uniref:uncharacterized protein LOC126380609 n=1 Tax=Pectinophora gossypiella TaxID=13191 RepID=UPI00214F4D52|nr:uncharacterized protein LOC126380609 [Pectinophora gossypiella]